MTTFLRPFAILACCCAAVMLALQWGVPGSIKPYSWYLLLFFAGVNLAAHALTARGLGDAADFSNRSMGATGLRLFLSAGVLFWFFWQVRDQATRVHFAATFFALYFLFTGFEIQALLSKLRRNSRKPVEKND
ncbi:MAG: hypothetical protein MUC97_08905 [Bernardetiaceae bacterium]|nr:hypothetical protein [Bernardetiaceae bacterium]